MKKQFAFAMPTFFIVIFVLSVFLTFSGSRMALAFASCDQCYQTALYECNILDPADDTSCFEETYWMCMAECCLWICEEEAWTCHDACEMDCEESCADQCEGDPECYDNCMDGCVDPCHEDCEMAWMECEGACMNEFDMDNDGIPDNLDNCLFVANPDQADGDSDGVGDACDNCPEIANLNQLDSDSDCAGDLCDLCPAVFSNEPKVDTDSDGLGDACDPDIDGDLVLNGVDNCPFVANPEQEDSNANGVGDACDVVDVYVSDHTTFDPTAQYAADLPAPNPDWTYQVELGLHEQNYMAWPFDIGESGRVVGYYRTRNCAAVSWRLNRGFVLGDNFDNDSNTDDTVRPTIGSLRPPKTTVWGIFQNNIFVGEYQEENDGPKYGFWARRDYVPESNLWAYTYHRLEYPGPTASTSAWDYAMVAGTGPTIVGRFNHAVEGRHGFTYDIISDTWVQIKYPGAWETFPCGINNSGAVSGYYLDDTGYHSFIYDGSYTPLNVPGAIVTYAYRVNNSGQVLGCFYKSNKLGYGFIWNGSSYLTFAIARAKDTITWGFNDNGEVVGYYRDATGTHGFSAGPITGPTCAYDLNGDHDVDGLDLAQFITLGYSSDPLKVAALAIEFGSTNCF